MKKRTAPNEIRGAAVLGDQKLGIFQGVDCDERRVNMKLKTKYAAGMRDELEGMFGATASVRH